MQNNPRNPNLAMLPAANGADELVLKTLLRETDRMIYSGTQRYSRYGLMFDTRYSLWSGQNDWGTKETDDAFPWPGASDTKVRLADMLIKERARMCKSAFWGKRVQAKALRAQNASAAQLVNTLLRWMLYTQSVSMVKREIELGLSYRDTYGSCIMGVFWRRQTRLESQTVSISGLQQMAMQAQDQQLMQLVQMITDPLHDPQTVQALAQIYPDNTPRDLQRFLKQLRSQGTAEIRSSYMAKNEPRWLAGRPGIDVFFDAALDDLQQAPIVVWRELLTEADLREREKSEGWDGDWIEEAVKHTGLTGLDSALDPLRLSPRGTGGRRAIMAEDTEQRIEVLHAYYFTHERGSAALYQTIFHRDVKDLAALHELQGYDHGNMPFHALRLETSERPILESRGIPEIVITWQGEEKTQRDFHLDRLSMEVLPALQVPRGYAGDVLMGPGQQIERKRAGDYEFLTPPPVSGAAEKAQTDRRLEICEYFGRAHPEADPTLVQLAKQELVTDFLTDMVPIIAQTFQLAQQFLTDEEVQAVAGPLAQGLQMGRSDIQGEFNYEFTFDVRTFDPAYVDTIVDALTKIMPMDRMGVIDMSGLVGFLFSAIDPNLAHDFIKPAQAAQMQDVNDELNQIQGIAVGIEPPMKPVSNPQLRLQVLQQALQSPRLQQIIKSDQTGISQKLIENQMAKYKFQVQQYTTNAQIGRLGVRPVLGGDGSGLPSPGGPPPAGTGSGAGAAPAAAPAGQGGGQ